MFFATFALALGSNPRHIGDIPFSAFLAPGLIMMATTQNAFANTSSSIMISKIQGNIIDMLMPPISAGEFLFAYAMAGVTRGVVVATAVGLTMWSFADFGVQSWGATIYFVLWGSLFRTEEHKS